MKTILTLLAITLAILIGVPDLDARGGGRGGGGGGRGGGGRGGGGGGVSRGGGGRSMNRSPSMSRASQNRTPNRQVSRSNRPSNTQRQGNRSDLNASRSRANQQPRQKTATRNDVQQFLQGGNARPSQRPSQGQGQRQQIANKRPGDRANTAANRQNRQNLADNIRRDIGDNRPNRGDWFNNNFWDRQNFRPPYYGAGRNGWGLATAAGVAGWLGWQNATPYYYDWGYSDDWNDNYWYPVDQNGTYIDTTTTQQQPQQYSERRRSLETTADTSSSSSDSWMPLGVFAIAKEGESKAAPNFYLQLALNKDGLISGTYYNATTDQAYEAEGLVDQQSQKAAWKVVDNDNAPILETGVYNLTQSEAPVRVHFSDGRTQEMMLVRLKQPQEGAF